MIDDVLSVCHLINRMPLYVIHGKVLFSCLYPNKSVVFITRVFGCTCFVQKLSPDLHKLSTRFIKCVFIGYSGTQKEYRCYNPSTSKYFVFADVIFFEYVPYFTLQSPDIAAEFIPLPPLIPQSGPALIPTVSTPASLSKTTIPHPRQNHFRCSLTDQRFLLSYQFRTMTLI